MEKAQSTNSMVWFAIIFIIAAAIVISFQMADPVGSFLAFLGI
ncbi:MAG: hypothetical protein ABIJ92_02125 [Candidatus Aenigmatarchaeota archaeon]